MTELAIGESIEELVTKYDAVMAQPVLEFKDNVYSIFTLF